MAIVPSGAKRMNFTFEDRDKNRSTLTLYAPSAVVSDDAATWATTDGVALLQPLTDARIASISIIDEYVNDDLTVPVEASDVERKGLFSFDVEGAGVSSFRIPSFLNTKVIDGTNTINTADAAVQAFINGMIDAGLIDVYGLGNFRGDKLVALATAPRKVHRGSTKG